MCSIKSARLLDDGPVVGILMKWITYNEFIIIPRKIRQIQFFKFFPCCWLMCVKRYHISRLFPDVIYFWCLQKGRTCSDRYIEEGEMLQRLYGGRGAVIPQPSTIVCESLLATNIHAYMEWKSFPLGITARDGNLHTHSLHHNEYKILK